jgi:hypothetical protein
MISNEHKKYGGREIEKKAGVGWVVAVGSIRLTGWLMGRR